MKTKLTHLLLTTVLAAGVAFPAAAQSTQAAQTGDPVADAKIADDEDKPQTGATNGDTAATVIVTGTRIVRPNNKSAAPIVTTTAAEIAAQGATTIEEVLNRLPQIQPNAEQNYADSNGQQRIKLRSLGFERTLTLVDGTRLGLVNQQDASIIPNALAERIDVLSGGASSVYGSDAVAGVVNFILKKNFDGIRLDANYSFYNHLNREGPVVDAARRANFSPDTGWRNDGGRSNITLSAGKNLFGGAVNLTGFVNYRRSDLIRLADRSYSSCEVTQPVKDGPFACSVATFTSTGTIIPRSPLAGANNGRFLVNDPTGARTFVPLNSGPGTAANPFDGLSYQREFERLNYGGFLTAKVSNALEFYGSALFYNDKSRNPGLSLVQTYLSFAGEAPYQTACNNPYLSAAQSQFLCGAQAGTSTIVPFEVRYRMDGVGPNFQRFVNRGYRLAGGIRGRLFDNVWNYDLTGALARNEATQFNIGNGDPTRIRRGLDVVSVNGTPTCRSKADGTDPNCVPFNPFIPYNSDTAFNAYIRDPSGRFNFQEVAQIFIPRMAQALLSVSGDLGKYGITSPLAEQGIAVAFGAEYRHEKQINSANAAFRQAAGGTDATFTQSIVEGNVEAQIPLVEDRSWTKLLQLNAGYRISKYNRLQGTFGTWKVEGIWSPIDDIGFRGAINKAQRAPSVTQADSASNIVYNNIGSRNDPCASTPNPANPNAPLPPQGTIEQCRRTGLPDNLYGSATLNCPDNACTIRNGGFGLTPETAYTKTFGVILRPRFVPGLTISVDRILVDLKDSINFYSVADFVNNCLATGLDLYCRGIVRNPGTFTLFSPPGDNPTTGFFAQGLTNANKSAFHSWDFQGQYGTGLGSIGRLDASFNGSLTTNVGNQDAPNLPFRNCAGYFGNFCGESLPRWSHNARLTWTSSDRIVNVSTAWRHFSGITLDLNATDPSLGIPINPANARTTYNRLPAVDYMDISAAFDIAKRFTLRLAVNNVFDRDPPLLPNTRSVLGLLRTNTVFRYDLLGRQLVAGLGMNF